MFGADTRAKVLFFQPVNGQNVAMGNFLTELKRRNVIRVAIAYVVVAWVVAQVLDLAADNFGTPDWVMKTALTLLAVGLPVALVFAWAFELTPEGVRKTREVPVERSITPQTGRKLNRLTMVALILALAFIAWDQFKPERDNVAVEIGDKSVAVLPFADLSENQDQEWFSDGLTEEILNSLARLPELQVTARTSSFEFKNTNIDIGEIAERLGVAHVVEGSVRRIGNQLRVTAQLIRAHDGFHLWSDTYDRNTDDLFDVQRDVAQNIAATLDVILDDGKRARMFSYGTQDVAAFEAYLRGVELFQKAHSRTGQATLADANGFFERAMDLDPRFSEPSLLHADRFAHYLIESKSAQIVGNNAELDDTAALSALRRDIDVASMNAPDAISRAAAELNQVFFSNSWHRMPALVKELRENFDNQAVSPSSNLWVDEILIFMGEIDLLERFQLARVESDPLNRSLRRDLAELALYRRDFDAALGIIDEARRTIGDTPSFRDVEIRAALLRKDYDTARELLQDDFYVSGDFAFYAPVRAVLDGDMDTARRLIDETGTDEGSTNMATTLLGDKARIRALTRAIDSRVAGPTSLALDLVYSQGLIWIDLDSVPNLKRRLEEAQIDASHLIAEI